MDSFVVDGEASEEKLLEKAVERAGELSSFINELDRMLVITQNRIEALAKDNQCSVLDKQEDLKKLGNKIGNLLKKAQSIEIRIAKLKRNFCEELHSINSLLLKLDRVGKTIETVKLAQMLQVKSKKNNVNQGEIITLASNLKGLSFAETILRTSKFS